MPTACFSGTIRRNSFYKAVSQAFPSSSVSLLSLHGARVQETAYASRQDLARMKERSSPLLLSISREPYRYGIYQSEEPDTTFLGQRRRSRRT